MKHVAVIATLFLGSCNAPIIDFETNIPDSNVDAGAVYFSVLSVRPWSEVSAKLQPNFTAKSAQEVLDMVVPVTTADLQIQRTATRIAGGLNPQSVTSQETRTNSSVFNEVTGEFDSDTETVEGVRTSAPGTVGDLDPAIALPTTGTALSAQTRMDPRLQYPAAAGLYQQIQLLNESLSGHVADEGKVAFLVRAQLNVVPYARNQPIDAFSRVSVTLQNKNEGHFDIGDISNSRVGDFQNSLTGDIVDSVVGDISSSRIGNISNSTVGDISNFVSGDIINNRVVAAGDPHCAEGTVEIKPLIILDSFEGSSNQRLAQALLQLEASVSSQNLWSWLGIATGTARERLREIASFDVNSLVTVSQPARNELLVRMGAERTTVSEYELLSRSHEASFIVIADDYNHIRNCKLSFSESTSFRLTENGRLIESMTNSDKNSLRRLLRETDVWREVFSHLIDKEELTELYGALPGHTPLSAIENVLYIRDSVDDDIINVAIPDWRVVPPLSDQTAVLVDIPNRGATVSVAGSKRVQPHDGINAILMVNWSKGPTQRFASTAIAVDDNGTLTFAFPSPSAIGRPSDVEAGTTPTYRLEVPDFYDHGDLSFDVARDAQRSQPATGKLTFTASAAATQIPIKNDANGPTGEGTITLFIDAKAGSEVTGYKVLVTGAKLDNFVQTVDESAPENIKIELNTIKLTQAAPHDGSINLELSQLTNDGKFSVVITPNGADGTPATAAKQTIEFTAKAMPKAN